MNEFVFHTGGCCSNEKQKRAISSFQATLITNEHFKRSAKFVGIVIQCIRLHYASRFFLGPDTSLSNDSDILPEKKTRGSVSL